MNRLLERCSGQLMVRAVEPIFIVTCRQSDVVSTLKSVGRNATDDTKLVLRIKIFIFIVPGNILMDSFARDLVCVAGKRKSKDTSQLI